MSRFPTTGLLDDFNRANSSTGMGANWSDAITDAYTEGTRLFGISSNQAYNASEASNYYGTWYWNAAQYGPDCENYLTIAAAPNGDDSAGIYIRMKDIPGVYAVFDAYGLFFDAPNTWKLVSTVNGTDTILASGTQALSAGDAIGLQGVGSTIKAFYKPSAGAWTELASVTDTAVSGAGYLGIYMGVFYGNGSATRYDNFSGGNYAPPRQMPASRNAAVMRAANW